MGYSSTTGQSCAGSSAGQTASSLKVVSPNGGEAFAPGQQIAVSWTSTGYSNTDMLTVYLAQKNTLDQYVTVTSLGKALVSAKQATFTIPSNVPTGNNYVIEIAATPASGFDIDQSDATFTIAASGTTVYPAGCTSSVGYSVTTGMSCSGTSNIAPALIVTKDVNDYNDRVVAGQATAATQAIPLATVDLTAQGSDVTLNRLPVHLTVTNSGTGASQAGTIINVLRIYNSAGMQIDSESVPANANAQVIFSNLSLHIAKGATQVLTIKGDLRPMDGTIVTNGATARITIAASDTAAIQAYDGNNNVINGNSLAGSTTGGTITFYVNGIQVSSTTPGTAVASTIGGSQVHNTLSFTIPFSVTAFGQNAYIPSFATPATAASADRAIQFCIDTATGACQAVGSSVLTYAGNDTLTIDNNGNYLIPVGQTKNFVLQVTYTANGAASYRASLLSVNWNNTDSSYLFNIFPVGLNSNAFRTNYVSAQAVVHPTTQSGCNGTKYSATTGQLCVYSQ